MKWADHYWHSIPVMKMRIEEIARRLADVQGPILEAGSNDGFVTQCLIEHGHTVTALEISDQAIAQAKEQFGQDFPIIKGDVRNIPFEDGSFDAVIGAEVLEHLDNPGEGLKELFRVSRGRVLLTLPIGHYWLGESTHCWEIQGQTIEHDQGIVRPTVKEILVLEWIKRRRWENGQCVSFPGWTYNPEAQQ